MSIDIQWVTSDQELSEKCAQWAKLSYLAVDTEFIRVSTFYPIAGLIQLSDGQSVFLIDPLLITDWQPFKELLESKQVIKVLHACGEDLEVFARLMEARPQRLFDTQIAAGLLNIGFSMGYSRLVQALLHIELPKGETRSDWLQRPLSETQVLYAAQDTLYLAQVYLQLAERLSAEKLQWLFEDGDTLVQLHTAKSEPELRWQLIKQAWKLNRQQLGVLQHLTAWREEQAMSRDVPRSRVLKDSSLYALAEQQPTSLYQLSDIVDMHPNTIRREGAKVLSLIQQALEKPAEQWPESLPQPLTVTEAKQLKKLHRWAKLQAQQLDIAPEMMVKKKCLEALLRSGLETGYYQLPESLSGWRRQQLGDLLLDRLQENV